MKQEKKPLDLKPGELQKAAFAEAAAGKKEVYVIEMPKTASGKPRFPSRMDGAEAGIVSGGMTKRYI